MFKHEFVANLSLRPLAKNVENRLISGEVMGRSLVSCFFDSQCSCTLKCFSLRRCITTQHLGQADLCRVLR